MNIEDKITRMKLMKRTTFIFFVMLSLLGRGKVSAQELTFSKETFSDGTVTLPYRKASFPGTGDKASLVIYLHGGSSRGDDNEAQMLEPGISSISKWLYDNNRKAVLLVPQCPQNQSWLGPVQDAIVSLLQTYIDCGVADASIVYIFGGSMGGTGTWNMLSNHPDFFAAAMPVAGNPAGLNAEAVSQTPFYTVMGTADRLMKISNVENFLKDMDGSDAEYKFDIETGWSHENVCENSYTDDRLDWVFGHVRGQASAVSDITVGEGEPVAVRWFSVSGRQLPSAPQHKGVYIKFSVYGDGSMSSKKYHVD